MEMPDRFTIEARARQLRQEELTRLAILGLAEITPPFRQRMCSDCKRHKSDREYGTSDGGASSAY